MKILIIGGAGRMAVGSIMDLVEIDTEGVSKVGVADLSLEKVKKVVASFNNNPKLVPIAIDASDHKQLVEVMKDFDVVLDETTGSGPVPVSIMKASLEAGVHAINLGIGGEEYKEALALKDEFVKKDLCYIAGLGSSPGITNLMARDLVNRLDSVETIDVCFAYESLGTSTLPIKEPFAFAFDEFIVSPHVYRDGKMEQLPPQGGTQYIHFPPPLGMREAFCIPHEEVETFPVSFKEKGVRNVSVRAAFTPDFVEKVNFLIDCGLLRHDPVTVDGVDVIPFNLLCACLADLPPEQGEVVDYGCSRVVVKGIKGDEKTEYVAEMLNRPYRGLTNAQHRTGHSPAIAARMILRGQITKRGVFPPEMGIDTKLFFKELAKRELEIALTSRSYI